MKHSLCKCFSIGCTQVFQEKLPVLSTDWYSDFIAGACQSGTHEFKISRGNVAKVPGDARILRHGLPEAACQRRSEEHTSELQSQSNLVCRLLLEKKKKKKKDHDW